MAHLYKRGQQYWISFYLDGKLKQKSLKTKNERVALSKKKQIEYELSIGGLHVASRLPLPVLLEAFCKYLKKTRTQSPARMIPVTCVSSLAPSAKVSN